LSPTGTLAVSDKPALLTANTSRLAAGVFTAKSREPSEDSASGRTWPLSKFVKRGGV
jgi:hypothetical protein